MSPPAAGATAPALTFDVFGRRIRILAPDAEIARLVAANWGALLEEASPAPVVLDYVIQRPAGSEAFAIHRNGEERTLAHNLSGLLFCLEKDLTIELQRQRRGLLFLHAAALDLNGRATLLVAASGSGKSTTAWALLHHGFRYLSDELAPVDLSSMTVHAYPHALCLKADPPGPYPLPAATIRTTRTFHVPTTGLPEPPVLSPRPIQAIFFLSVDGEAPCAVRPLNPAEGASRLYVNALNLLAHPAAGLDAVVAIAEKARCFEINRSDLAVMSDTIRAAVSAL